MKGLAVCLLVVSSMLCQPAGLAFAKTDKSTLIQSAVDQAKALGYETSQMNVVYDEGNLKAEEQFKDSGIPAHQKAALTGKNWQAVYLGPKRLQLGGDLWVFVDQDTGKVITYIGGK